MCGLSGSANQDRIPRGRLIMIIVIIMTTIMMIILIIIIHNGNVNMIAIVIVIVIVPRQHLHRPHRRGPQTSRIRGAKIKGNHLSSTTCLTHVFFKRGESCSKFN